MIVGELDKASKNLRTKGSKEELPGTGNEATFTKSPFSKPRKGVSGWCAYGESLHLVYCRSCR